MGGGSLYDFNTTTNHFSTVESGYGQSSSRQANQLNNRRSLYNPFLNLEPSWSATSVSSTASVYPKYDPSEFHIEPISLAPPELPPRPAAYRHSTTPIPSNNKVRLIYTKSGFYLKTTEDNTPDNNYSNSIHGFLAIFSKSMENVEIMIAWIPEYLIEPHDIARFIELDGVLAADQGFPDVDLNMGEGETMTIALKNIYSLYICPPSITQGTIIITSQAGDILKPLWYSAPQNNSSSDHHSSHRYLDTASWPGYDIIDILSAFIPLQRDTDECVYLVGEDVSVTNRRSHSSNSTPFRHQMPSSAASRDVSVEEAAQEHRSTMTTESISREAFEPQPSSSATMSTTTAEPITKTIRDARWTLLERLSKITQYSRDTATQVLDHPIARPLIPLLPTSVQALSSNSRNGTMQNTLNEYQMASHYLARWGTYADRTPASSAYGNYYLADDVDGLLVGMPELCGPAPIHTRRPPISPEEWVLFFDAQGKLVTPVEQVRKAVFSGGLDTDIRIEAWKFLLGIYPWTSNFNEREALRRSRADAYFRIKAHWFDHPEVRNTQRFEDEKHRIDKDVHRTDRSQEAFLGDELPNPDPAMAVGTNANLEIMKDILVTYNFHNTDLGYVQGMSDLLAPLFVAMGDEAMAFWTFSAFMDRVQSNFFTDQSGMHRQLKTLDALIRFMDPGLHRRLEETETSNLFFCFRWLLVWFKREFEWEDVVRLWEVLWTDHLSDQMILFIALAVIDMHRKEIMEDLNQFDEVLRYINDLTGKIPLESTLERAEVLFYQFERKVRAMQHKQSMLKEQLQQRSVWNSKERPKIQERIEKLKVSDSLLALLPPSSPLNDDSNEKK
ncbi:MAG: rab-GTPase-TBC domain-containing protein [Benjaminiella poitrasii]|nr:MAG: rab-GTPase-TBC domain-containing protein [Benjaminiella poitrasii]